MENLKSIITKSLYFLRLTDAETKVSLTNILVIVLIVKLIMVPALSVADLTALGVAVFGYQFKRLKGDK